MPLPPNTNLSLLGYSRPGDTLQSKPKQAILVRLSSETLDALESFSTQPSQIQFEFGDNPGIYVGDTHFPMRHSKENAIHELFLRASSATKRNAPLKLHANVIGKFTVERELAGVRDKIRESIQDAANQRNSRTTVFIETPPDIPPNPRKRKEAPSSMFRKPLRPSDKLTAPQLTTSVSAPTKGANNSSQSHPSPARRQVVQCLALGEKTEEQLMRALEGFDRTLPSRRELQDLLDLVAEPTTAKGNSTDKAPKAYRLKPIVWKEVRPYEWPTLSEPEKTTIARSARIAFQNLGIPENDPVWNHVRFRASVATASSMTLTTDHAQTSVDAVSLQKKQDISKRPVTSREAKERKNKPKLDTKAEIMMKDESFRVATRTILHDDKPKPFSENRRIAEASLSETTHSQSSQISKTAKSQAAESYSPSSAISKIVSVRQAERDTTLLISGSKLPTDLKGTLPVSSSQKTRKKRREDDISVGESDREKRRSKGEKAHLNNTVDVGRDGHSVPLLTKRRALEHSADVSPDTTLASNLTKRRRTEYQSPSSVSSSSRLKDPPAKELTSGKSYPDVRPSERPVRKPLPSSSVSLRSKMDDSPASKRHAMPNIAESAFPESSSRPRTSNSESNKSSAPKSRRPPVYTSSEDEETPLPPSRPSGNGSVLIVTPTARALHSRNSSMTRALPTDHAALRERYNKSYAEYLESFQRLFVQKDKINDLLKSKDRAGSITDSEGDTELMDSEELARLTNDHKRLEEELASIRQVFEVVAP